MPKALAIRTSYIFGELPKDHELDLIIPYPEKILELPTELLNWPECKCEEDYLQLIPYVTLYDANTCEIFMLRGVGNKCELGHGYHIGMSPDEVVCTNNKLCQVIALESARELHVMFGLEFSSKLIDSIKKRLTTNNFGLIHYRGDASHKAQLGISIFIPIKKSDLKLNENGSAIEGQWIDTADLESLIENDEIKLSHWSRILLGIVNLDVCSYGKK